MFRSPIPAIILILLFRALPALGAPLQFEKLPAKGYPEMHKKGQSLIKSNRKNWVHARSKHFVIHGADKALFGQINRESEHAWYKTGYFLGLRQETRPFHVLVVTAEKEWQQITGVQTDQASKLAAQLEGTIFLYRPANLIKQGYTTDIAHEVVHARLHCAYPDIPLWLEEGLALRLGIKLTREFHRTSGVITRERVINDDGAVPTDRSITSFVDYPQELEDYYRQCRIFVGALEEAVGEAQLKQLVKQLSVKDVDWKQVLQETFSVSVDRIKDLEKRSLLHSLPAKHGSKN